MLLILIWEIRLEWHFWNEVYITANLTKYLQEKFSLIFSLLPFHSCLPQHHHPTAIIIIICIVCMQKRWNMKNILCTRMNFISSTGNSGNKKPSIDAKAMEGKIREVLKYYVCNLIKIEFSPHEFSSLESTSIYLASLMNLPPLQIFTIVINFKHNELTSLMLWI